MQHFVQLCFLIFKETRKFAKHFFINYFFLFQINSGNFIQQRTYCIFCLAPRQHIILFNRQKTFLITFPHDPHIEIVHCIPLRVCFFASRGGGGLALQYGRKNCGGPRVIIESCPPVAYLYIDSRKGGRKLSKEPFPLKNIVKTDITYLQKYFCFQIYSTQGMEQQ